MNCEGERSGGENHSDCDDGFEVEPLFGLLVSYLGGDRARALAEVRELIAEGRSLREACEVVIASGGYEASFY